MVYREAMLRLEDKADIVLMLAVRNDKTIESIHFGTKKEGINIGEIINRILEDLRRTGITGGGREKVGAIQLPLLTIRQADTNKLIEVITKHIKQT